MQRVQSEDARHEGAGPDAAGQARQRQEEDHRTHGVECHVRDQVSRRLQAVERVIEKLGSDEYDLVIADELNVAYDTNLIDRAAIQRILDARPSHIHLIVTGRGAPEFLIESADMVTEMREVKHPYQRGVKAQPGIDY